MNSLLKKLLYIYFIHHLTNFCYGKDIFVNENDRISDVVKKAEPYDKIIISCGTYREHSIEINKPLELTGKGNVFVDGGFVKDVIIINSDNVKISGLTIINSALSGIYDYAGIRVENSSNITITGNRLLNNFFGIMLIGSDSCIISANEIKSNAQTETSSGNGIHLWKCSSITILGNNISGHRDGIYFEFVTMSKVTNNYSSNNIRYGLHFMFSNNNTYRYNTFIRNGAGVAVMYSKTVEMTYNNFLENTGPNTYGLLLKDITDSYLENNTFKHNTTALYAEGSNRVKIISNRFMSNGWAIKMLGNCEDNITENCIFINNSFDVATNSTRTMSYFKNNYWDNYKGYDLDKDGKGDVPYYPVSLYSIIVHKTPESIFLLRSFIVDILNISESIFPVLTPENLVDNSPLMKPRVSPYDKN